MCVWGRRERTVARAPARAHRMPVPCTVTPKSTDRSCVTVPYSIRRQWYAFAAAVTPGQRNMPLLAVCIVTPTNNNAIFSPPLVIFSPERCLRRLRLSNMPYGGTMPRYAVYIRVIFRPVNIATISSLRHVHYRCHTFIPFATLLATIDTHNYQCCRHRPHIFFTVKLAYWLFTQRNAWLTVGNAGSPECEGIRIGSC